MIAELEAIREAIPFYTRQRIEEALEAAYEAGRKSVTGASTPAEPAATAQRGTCDEQPHFHHSVTSECINWRSLAATEPSAVTTPQPNENVLFDAWAGQGKVFSKLGSVTYREREIALAYAASCVETLTRERDAALALAEERETREQNVRTAWAEDQIRLSRLKQEVERLKGDGE